MKRIHSFTNHLKIQTFVHILLICFALASVGTIGEFFLANGHNWLTSYGLAVALGFGLVLVSVMLAGTDLDDRPAFLGMVAAVSVVAVMSAIVQSMSYQSHVRAWSVALVLGIGFPLIECVLALGVALHDAAERRRRMLDVRDTIQQRISESVGEAMAEIDVSKVRGYIEHQVDGIVRQQLDVVIATMGFATLPPNRTTKSPNETACASDNLPQITTNSDDEAIVNILDGLDLANETRQQLVEVRQQAIPQLCEQFGAMSAPELVKRLGTDRAIEVSVQTVRDDCKALVESDVLIRVGRRWDVASARAGERPRLNGYVA